MRERHRKTLNNTSSVYVCHLTTSPSPGSRVDNSDANAISARQSASIIGPIFTATGSPLPQYCQIKSASALSRFLNQYQWSTRKVIKAVRGAVLQQILLQPAKGRRPRLQVVIDLTTLEKRGKFKALDAGVRVYHHKHGLHLVVMYLVVGQWRFPWSFRIYRGKDTPSPTQLGLRLLGGLPKVLTQHFDVLVLADTAFGSMSFWREYENSNIMPLRAFVLTAS